MIKDDNENPYGQIVKFRIGDKVRIWKIWGFPSGTIDKVVDKDGPQIRYSVHYKYHTGEFYTEEFDGKDLTLIEKWLGSYDCNCNTPWEDRHERWCNRTR